MVQKPWSFFVPLSQYFLMNYTEYQFHVSPPQPWKEILIALLSQIEFESFEENPEGLKAYILSDCDDEDFVKEQIESLVEAQITYEKKNVPPVNWNQEWETHFSPININNQCYIRADFHEPQSHFEHEIIIQPKMSFGTGHHETTHLMVEYILENHFEHKSVLDMGTGTGILAILTKMKGAKEVLGIDIDEWSYANAVENSKKNKMEVDFLLGGAETIPNKTFDFVFANINKNILKADMPFYVNALKPKASLFLSGLLDFDEQDIKNTAEKFGLKFVSLKNRNEWIALHFTKK